MPPVSVALARYRTLEEDLHLIRAERQIGSLIEEPILEEMARVWWTLSDVEREILDREEPTCNPAIIDYTDDLNLVDLDTLSPEALSNNQVGGPRRAKVA